MNYSMNNLDKLTILIVTFLTDKQILLNCLNSIDRNVKILIVENSSSFKDKKFFLKKFSNLKIVTTGENLGYGKGNNFGLKLVKTSYALILNPDVICDKDFFDNIVDVTNEPDDFTIIGCQYLNDKVFMPAGFFDKRKNTEFKDNFIRNEVEALSKVEWVTGCSMLVNLKKFEEKEIFDNNFFYILKK